MADFVSAEGGAENVVVYDVELSRRFATVSKLALDLHLHGWAVHYFSGPAADTFATMIPEAAVYTHVNPGIDDVRRLAEDSKATKVAVIIDGIMAAGGTAMNRLLKNQDIFVVSATVSKAVRGDHRYSRVWTVGKGWRSRGEPKGFIVVNPERLTGHSGWLDWLW